MDDEKIIYKMQEELLKEMKKAAQEILEVELAEKTMLEEINKAAQEITDEEEIAKYAEKAAQEMKDKELINKIYLELMKESDKTLDRIVKSASGNDKKYLPKAFIEKKMYEEQYYKSLPHFTEEYYKA